MKFGISIAFISLISAAACQQELPKIPPGGEAFIPKGFLCSVTPSTAYSPGYVFRIDASGAEYLVLDGRDNVETIEDVAALGTYSASVTRSAAFGLSLLADAGPVASGAGVDASGGSSSGTTMKFSDGMIVQMEDRQEKAYLDAVQDEIRARPGSRYYFVRDAIQAKGVDIRLSAGDEAKLGGEAKVADLVSAKPNFEYKRTEKLEVIGTFDEPLNVCVRAVEIFETPDGDVVDSPVEGQVYLAQEDLAKIVTGMK
ncbi:hypothetical protein [Ruegeria sp. R14_0]|uniref:hypothetical protein n=1 Tax=Ruegeria sp. R14_0 TaxID=2821100 RepID=UPI001ADD5F7A|nr:hypothetical protein [Ruegeria sp. R14_0]MBO9448553.1 hypothetical protein [Ruegeria sp. R14_0]